MKTLILANLYGEFETVNKLFDKHPEVDMCISLGDNYLFSSSTPLQYFLRRKFRDQAIKTIEKNKNGVSFTKPLFSLYGELDDPFIPQEELKFVNFFPMWQSTMDFMVYNSERTKSKTVKVGFFSGYYNCKSFKKNNVARYKMSRERKSLALCKDDFSKFAKNKLDYLFTHDAPNILFPLLNRPQNENVGCPALTKLIYETSPLFSFHGHHRIFTESYGMMEQNPPYHCYGTGETTDKALNIEHYYILDMYNNTIEVK